jgi:alkylated DNA nucleotide flippase Atl1
VAYRRKSWREKLQDEKGLPKIVELKGNMVKVWGEGTMVVPRPRDVAELMRKVPKGRLTTVNALRETLAARHGADKTCPIVTGLSTVIAARAAAEDEADGKKRITPYWRTLKSGGELNPKYPGGIEAQAARLAAEGHSVVQKGKKSRVVDFQRRLARL